MKISAGSLLFLVPYVAALNITQYEIKLPSCSLDCLSSCRPINGNISLGISCVCADLSISDNSNSCINEGCPRKESWGQFRRPYLRNDIIDQFQEATRLTNELCIRQRPSRQPQLLSTVAFGALASITVNLRLYLKQVYLFIS
ncbi:uncharacterized protein RSE6_09111 [Rhynchosporium secalis]|uniref:Uncharacterized protein n=1 Tax=Rhynchosporium secalis TaxID=38038 RepID=A0A1E1MH73_RHYSE|nr:uncharacterized protein RSE6_09111 [Rhynchosporium secalis]